MEIGEERVQQDEIYTAVKRNEPLLLRDSLVQSNPDFNKLYGMEGNVINMAIVDSSLEMLATLLGLEYPVWEGEVELPLEKYEILEKPCSADQLTPLMQSVRCGKRDIVSFLLRCGISVNRLSRSKAAAIDFVSDGMISLLLVRADSLLHSLRRDEGRQRLETLMNECEELKEFFERRDHIHEVIKKGELTVDVMEAVDSAKSQYFINSKGETALWQAAEAVNTDAWAYLNSKRLKCAGKLEEEDVKLSKDSYEDRFNRSLIKYFFEAKGTHVMKMVAKSRVFGNPKGRIEGQGQLLKEFYECLDEYDETQILLEVLQDELDFEVVFDFDSSNVNNVCVKSSRDREWGLTDFLRKRVYVGAMENQDYKRCNVIGTLSHELAHKALMVVFQNQGKPYKEGDSESMEMYQDILRDVMLSSNLKNCDEVIRRVAGYSQDVWEQELIVRVPEIIAKYCQMSKDEDENEYGTADDGIDVLEEQVEQLLNFYRDHLMPAFRKFVDNNITSNKMTVKIMSEYQRLLLDSMNDSISVGSDVQDMGKHIHDHNGLKILVVSNIQLCYSHLKNIGSCRRECVLLVGWSQFRQPQSGYLDGLSNGAFDLLAVRWDVEDEAKICRRSKCRDDCIGNMFGGLCSRVIVVLTKPPSSLKKVSPLEYIWSDLSESTKAAILGKRVSFVGCPSTLNDVVSDALLGEDSVEDFMKEHLLPSDITFLLKEEDINVGKVTGWAGKGKGQLLDQRCYIKRHISQMSIELSGSLVDRSNDVFIVVNATKLDLRRIEISESSISVWDPSHLNKSIKCYLVDGNVEKDIDTIFDKICINHAGKEGIHLLMLRDGKYFYVKTKGSVKSLLGFVNYENEDMTISENEFLQQKFTLPSTDRSANTDEDLDAVIIADEPGCGKSFIVNNFVRELRRGSTLVWMSVVDLNFYAQIKSPVQLGEIKPAHTLSFEELLETLFIMVGHGNSSFEKTLFKHYSQKPKKVIIMFDGFDEICPKYRENVIGFLEALQAKSVIKVCATTRLHERRKLEEKMNVIAYKLIPFSYEEQVDFLCRYWNAHLRSYSGEERVRKIESIEYGMRKWLSEISEKDQDMQSAGISQISGEARSRKIDFKEFAEKLILSIDQLVEGFKQFTRTPLHIRMVAFIVFEEDFRIGSSWDLGQLYQRFIDIKLVIFEREKVLTSGNVSSDKSFSMAKKRVYELLENLSANEFFDPKYFAFERGEMYDSLSIGLTVEREETYQFIHRTFGEFFFARWLLRDAQRENVTKFWLEQLFADKALFRVRWFLEDIIQVHFKGINSASPMLDPGVSKITHLCPSVVPQKRLLECLNACLFGIIVEGSHCMLQYFSSGFGCELIKLFMGDENFPSGSGSTIEETVELILQGRWEKPIEIVPEYDILMPDFSFRSYIKHPKIRRCVSAPRYNAFTLAYKWHESSSNKVPRHDKTFVIVQKMLSLIEENKLLENLNAVFSNHGFEWILPSVSHEDSYEYYFSEILKFLEGKNMALFKSSLRKSFLNESSIWETVKRRNMSLFNLVAKLADMSLEELEFEPMFLKNEDFLKIWLSSVRYDSEEKILQIWEFVEKRLNNENSRLTFFTKHIVDRSDIHHPKYVNVLTNSVLTNDIVRVILVWKLATRLMDREMFNEWFLTSFIEGQPSLYSFDFTPPPVIFKFLSAQLTDGHMNEDEVVKILMSKGTGGKRYFLKIDTDDNSIESLHSFYKLLKDGLKLRAKEVLLEMEHLYWYLIKALSESKYKSRTEEIPSDIFIEFEKIISSDSSGLVEQLKTSDGFNQKYNSQYVKTFLVLFYKYLELGWNCFGSGVLKFFQSTSVYSKGCPNILHHLLKCQIPFSIGFICAALLKFSGSDDVIDLLFTKTMNRNSVFHMAAMEKDYVSWGEFYDVARVLMNESALGEVHTLVNDNGKCVQDLFLRESK